MKGFARLNFIGSTRVQMPMGPGRRKARGLLVCSKAPPSCSPGPRPDLATPTRCSRRSASGRRVFSLRGGARVWPARRRRAHFLPANVNKQIYFCVLVKAFVVISLRVALTKTTIDIQYLTPNKSLLAISNLNVIDYYFVHLNVYWPRE